MKTNILIDKELIAEAVHSSGLPAQEAVQQALQLFIKFKKQERIKNYRGKLNWEGDLGAMRINE